MEPPTPTPKRRRGVGGGEKKIRRKPCMAFQSVPPQKLKLTSGHEFHVQGKRPIFRVEISALPAAMYM